MSVFLPEGFGQQSPSPVDISTGAASESTQGDIALMQRVLTAAVNNPNLIPENFMAYMLDWIQTQRLNIPIGQVFGFPRFTMQSSPLVGGALETTASTSFVNLATVGPTIDGISDGKYVVWICNLSAIDTGGQQAIMALSVNGAAADITLSTEAWSSAFDNISKPFLLTFDSGGANSIVAKYKSSGGGTATFFKRQLFALRYAN